MELTSRKETAAALGKKRKGKSGGEVNVLPGVLSGHIEKGDYRELKMLINHTHKLPTILVFFLISREQPFR